VSNLERDPPELIAGGLAGTAVRSSVILEPRDVPLGGPRAMTVRRTLPQRERSLIGPWCFVDHYGPDPVSHGGMTVPPHPHTGLQTVSWLFEGEIEHRDSAGSHAMVRPGELNLMTAGRGIQHSEVSTTSTSEGGSTSGGGSTSEGGPSSASGTAGMLHGAQLWVALPDAYRGMPPFFEHYAPLPFVFDGVTVRVFLGTLLGESSPATVFSPIVGAQLDLPARASIELPVDIEFEHGVLLDVGSVAIDGLDLPLSHLSFTAVGAASIHLEAGDNGARLLLIGGAPFGESIVMWWNFIGRSHDEIVQFRNEWQRDVIAGVDPAGPFGAIPEYPGSPLPAPEMPAVRLKPRG
jgi:redox-sensitive bicupin YhaK (pirin superfamily)